MIRNELNRELHLALKITLTMAVLAEMFSLSGIIPAPHESLLGWFTPPMNYFTFGSLFVHFFILRFFSRPSWREGAQTAGITVAFLVACLVTDYADDVPVWYLATTPTAAFGLISFASFVREMRRSSGDDRARNHTLLTACGVLLAIYITSDSFLAMTSALRPATFDYAAYIIDGSLGFQPSIFMTKFFGAYTWLDYAGTMSYFFIAYGFSALFGLQLAQPEKISANIIKFIVFCFSSVFFLYLFCPVAGPEYAFGSHFPNSMPPADELSAAAAVIPPAPRNGVPSMHVGWALGMFINALPFARPVRILFGAMLVLNILATLGLGEHYLIDLVMSFPCILAIQALCLGPDMIGRRNYVRAVGFGIGVTALWLLGVRMGAPLLAAVPGLTWLAVILTVGGSYWFARPLLGLTRPMPEATAGGEMTESRPGRSWSVPEISAALLFFVSGFAALIYQVLFSKALSYTFGSAATATFTVLATYMGGMAMGAWIGGRVAERRSDPLRIYAICELGIALYCIATPMIFSAIQSLYVSLAAGSRPDEVSLLLLRFALGVIVLLPPTMLMGMTLPVLMRQLVRSGELPGASLAALYSANTVGAAFGALLSGYLIIPALGMTNSVRLAAWMNILVAGAAYIIFTRYVMPGKSAAESAASVDANQPPSIEAKRLGRAALLILGLGGVVSLGLEVAYVHVLAIVAGNSVYAFALMLFAFLLALGAGSEVARRLLLRNWQPAFLVSLAQTGLALCIVGGIFVWAKLPEYFASFQGYPSTATFGAREFVRGVVCFIGMFPAAFCIGLSYAPCLQLAAAGSTRGAQSIGAGIALNTAGNIFGVLLVGFVLLPSLGALPALHVLAAVSALLAVCLFAALERKQRIMIGGGAAAIMVLIVLQPSRFDYDRLATGANVYFAQTLWGDVIDHAESMDGGLTSVHVVALGDAGHEVKTLLTNGKFQGNDSTGGEMVAQASFGLLPLLHTPNRDEALVIGYGTGTTARVLSDAGFARMDMVDLSRDVFELANRHFRSVNNGVATRPGVQTYVTDGRNFLLLGKKQYDLICVELSSIWFAGAAALYNREFYALARSRLGDSGVLQQWIQLHHVEPTNVVYMLGSVRAEFQYVWLYLSGDQGIVVASNDPARRPDVEYALKMDGTETMRALMPPDATSFASLQDKVLLDPDDVDRLLRSFEGRRGVPVSTDDNVVLEYSTPKGNVLDTGRSLTINVDLLSRFQGEGDSVTPTGVSGMGVTP